MARGRDRREQRDKRHDDHHRFEPAIPNAGLIELTGAGRLDHRRRDRQFRVYRCLRRASRHSGVATATGNSNKVVSGNSTGLCHYQRIGRTRVWRGQRHGGHVWRAPAPTIFLKSITARPRKPPTRLEPTRLHLRLHQCRRGSRSRRLGRQLHQSQCDCEHQRTRQLGRREPVKFERRERDPLLLRKHPWQHVLHPQSDGHGGTMLTYNANPNPPG